MNKDTLLSIRNSYLTLAADIRCHKKRMAFEEYNAGRLRTIIDITDATDNTIDSLIENSDEYCYIYNKTDKFWIETIKYLDDIAKQHNLDNPVYNGMCQALTDMELNYNSLVKEYKDNAASVYKNHNKSVSNK